MTEPHTQRQKCVLCGLLALAVLAAFWPALRCGFVNYDDPSYVTENWHVRHGFNGPDIRWAFSAVTASNWHPLTWLSHMLDCQCYGLQPAGHHLTSLLLHLANAVLLCLLLNRLTGALWRSAIVAALFALHPLRVESVVWISERKDVLSSLFWLLTVWAYVRYVEEYKVQGSKFKVFYVMALLLFAFALMSKPMAVTLPFVLLLLDYWPMGRLRFEAKFSWQPVVEKIPFFVLTVASSLVTFLVQDRAGTIASMTRFPLNVRLENMPVAYVRYLISNFWPANLAAYYPYVEWPAWEIICAVVLLTGVTGLALWRARTSPYLVMGWFWFLGMLVPTIGLVQAGGQSLADRYTYLSSIGLWILVVWGLHDLAAARLRPGLVAAAGFAVAIYATLTWHHASDYRDSGALWDATLRSYPDCLAAQNNLSRWLIEQGRWTEALDHGRKALDILPNDPTAHDDLSRIFLHQGNVDDAIAEGLKSVQSQPHSEVNRQTLGRAYLQKHDFADAAASLREAIKIDPSASDAWCNLGYTLLQQGQIPTATEAYEKALDLNPDYALAHNDLGNIRLRQGRFDEAAQHFQRAVEIAPTLAEAHYNLAGIFAQRGQLDEAIAHCKKAVEIQPNLAPARQRLAALIAARERNSGR